MSGTRALLLNLPEELYDWLKAVSHETQTTMAEIVRRAIERELNRAHR